MIKVTTCVDHYLDALDSVTWYNGLAEEIVKWTEPGYFDEEHGFLNWKWKKFRNFDLETQHQLEVIWIIAVELFGECGTSPRSGWIENKADFYEFCHYITQTYREAKERGDEC